MPAQASERAMTAEERAYLAHAAHSGPTWFWAAIFGLVRWLFTSAIIILGWLAAAWLVRAMLDAEIGWHSAAAKWAIPLSGVAAAIYVIGRTVAPRIKNKNRISKIEADLESGQVVEELYEIAAAKRMQEQEHGGLIYFLHTTDDRVLVVYDAESQQLGVLNEDPLSSEFRPRRSLTMVRAPHTGYVLDKIFSGEPPGCR